MERAVAKGSLCRSRSCRVVGPPRPFGRSGRPVVVGRRRSGTSASSSSKGSLETVRNGTPRSTRSDQSQLKLPHSLEEVDNGKILGFGADLSEDHPGYRDSEYKQRRKNICDLARDHKVGEPIPYLPYTAEESNVWSIVMQELEPLYAKHACASFRRSYPMFGFSPHAVPQLQDLHKVLQATTGWSIRPTAGLLHPRDFLAGLAFRCFHSTQYMRHHSKPSYTPEPDIVHEALGHMAMLADPAFCDLVQHIGIASLGADEKTIWKLTKIYWYTVEFGVVWEDNEVKAFGAGVLSSFGEIKNMASGSAEIRPFDPFAKLPAMSYKDGYQKHYFALESFDAGAAKLREYCDHLQAQLPKHIRDEVKQIIQTTERRNAPVHLN